MILYRKVTDAEKRSALGEALFQIRLPIMKLDEFKQYVATSEILLDREVRDLLTHLVGVKPNRELPFIAEERTGNPAGEYAHLQFHVEKVIRKNVTFPEGVSCTVGISQWYGSGYIEISEVEFCNPADFPIDDVQIHNNTEFYADKIEKIPEKLCMGNSVYKAVFTPPAKVKASDYYIEIYFRTKSYSGPGTVAKLCGTESQTVTIDGWRIDANICNHGSINRWNCLLGMKMKAVIMDSDSD